MWRREDEQSRRLFCPCCKICRIKYFQTQLLAVVTPVRPGEFGQDGFPAAGGFRKRSFVVGAPFGGAGRKEQAAEQGKKRAAWFQHRNRKEFHLPVIISYGAEIAMSFEQGPRKKINISVKTGLRSGCLFVSIRLLTLPDYPIYRANVDSCIVVW